jgi:hypothetical protein
MEPGATIQFLLLGGLLGLFGQGARAVIGLKTLTDYANGPAPRSDVFDAARLIISLVIGFLAGIAAALTYYAIVRGAAVNLGLEQLLGFAGAGYIGTDVIESFIVKYFDKTSTTGVKDRRSGTPLDEVSLSAFASSLDALTLIKDRIPDLLFARPMSPTPVADRSPTPAIAPGLRILLARRRRPTPPGAQPVGDFVLKFFRDHRDQNVDENWTFDRLQWPKGDGDLTAFHVNFTTTCQRQIDPALLAAICSVKETKLSQLIAVLERCPQLSDEEH